MLNKNLLSVWNKNNDLYFDLKKNLSLDVIVRCGTVSVADTGNYVGYWPMLSIGNVLLPDGSSFPSDRYPRLSSFYTINRELMMSIMFDTVVDPSLKNKTAMAEVVLSSDNLFNERRFLFIPTLISYVNNNFYPELQRLRDRGVVVQDIADKKIYATIYRSAKSGDSLVYDVLSSNLWDGSLPIQIGDGTGFIFTEGKVSGTGLPDIPNEYLRGIPSVTLNNGKDYSLHIEAVYDFV